MHSFNIFYFDVDFIAAWIFLFVLTYGVKPFVFYFWFCTGGAHIKIFEKNSDKKIPTKKFRRKNSDEKIPTKKFGRKKMDEKKLGARHGGKARPLRRQGTGN